MAFELYKNKRQIEIYDVSMSEKPIAVFDANNSTSFRNDSEELVIKLVVKDGFVGIPWCMLQYSKDEILLQVDNCKLGKQLVSTYKRLQEFPYYDEDYTVLNTMRDCEGTILDVGANYGQSMYAFYNVLRCNIISFEVVPDLYEVLKIMKQLIDCEDRVRIINSGISDKEEEIVWYEPSNPVMSGSFDKQFISGRKLGVDIAEKIMKCKPLDDLIDSYENIWFIKMDVEGFEFEALKGAKRIIKENHPVILIEQNEKIESIQELLGDEYELWYYDLYADRFSEKRVSKLNCWLIPKEGFRSDNVKKLIAGRVSSGGH
ncbi:MAG: FkbM family methyltransferase [Epulopiscium sp.]|nr:FkbM family methyltransferase [Candidatus Epulonipiscium sp.]